MGLCIGASWNGPICAKVIVGLAGWLILPVALFQGVAAMVGA